MGRSPGEGNGNPLQNYGLENPLDRGAWQATDHGVEKSQARLSKQQFFTLFQISYYMDSVTHAADTAVITGLLHLLGQEVNGKSDYLIRTNDSGFRTRA